MTTNSDHIEILKKEIAKSVMHEMVRASDFDALYEEIRHRTGETIGVSTLKRLWGYIDGYKSVRESTLDVLSRFVGYPDWHTFVAECCGNKEERTSYRVVTSTLESSELEIGAHVVIEWNPGRRLLLQHKGEGWFDVLEAQNSKVKSGDRFHCDRFMIGQPLYVDSLTHADQSPTLFVMGKKGGLTKIEAE